MNHFHFSNAGLGSPLSTLSSSLSEHFRILVITTGISSGRSPVAACRASDNPKEKDKDSKNKNDISLGAFGGLSLGVYLVVIIVIQRKKNKSWFVGLVHAQK